MYAHLVIVSDAMTIFQLASDFSVFSGSVADISLAVMPSAALSMSTSSLEAFAFINEHVNVRVLTATAS